MAIDDTKKKDAKKDVGKGTEPETKKYGDRVLILGKAGELPTWQDTGETTTIEAAEEYALLYVGPEADGVQHEDINIPVLFWVKEVVDKQSGRNVPNTIRGMIVQFFEPPEEFNAKRDEDEDESDAFDVDIVDAKGRLCAWVKLTSPCWVKTLEKEIVRAKVGDMVWMDINHAMTGLVRAAAPKPIDPSSGLPQGIVEMEVEPKRKVAFKPKRPLKNNATPMAWRMRISGGWGQAYADAVTHRKGGFRSLKGEEIARFAARFQTPSILSLVDAITLAGLKQIKGVDPQLDAHDNGDSAMPSLPESATRVSALPAVTQTSN